MAMNRYYLKLGYRHLTVHSTSFSTFVCLKLSSVFCLKKKKVLEERKKVSYFKGCLNTPHSLSSTYITHLQVDPCSESLLVHMASGGVTKEE